MSQWKTGLAFIGLVTLAAAAPAGQDQVQVAKSKAEALRNCGPAPKTPGPWRCEGRHPVAPPKGSANDKVHFTYQKITWTWVQGGKTASDDWTQ
jgi:hypothetical protein